MSETDISFLDSMSWSHAVANIAEHCEREVLEFFFLDKGLRIFLTKILYIMKL